MIVLAIDPGPTESAWVRYDTESHAVLAFGKEPNGVVRHRCRERFGWKANHVAIEMIASYGMAVGAEVFETVRAIGRFEEAASRDGSYDGDIAMVYRREVKLQLCGDSRAKDPNIRQALIDRYGGKDRAMGRKAAPGPLYGITGDAWSALAVAVTWAETRAQAEQRTPVRGAGA